MFVVVNELFVADADREVFERNFGASMRGTLSAVPGLVGARLMRAREVGRGYVSMLEFADEAAYIGYLQSDAFRAAHDWPDHAPIESNVLSTYSVITDVVENVRP
ncbi:antibiotic biosynthesis monooxygenase family protein [Nocardia sp. NPDC004860]|uniref:antibiotic biosynthesis monooxygenase family protein n=1 Tax=unclassified Nocardia TaxID=2637762 RepID=UPI0033B0C1D9